MRFMTFPMLIFVALNWVAYSQGMTAFATLALSGAWLCLGMIGGWHMWKRSNRRKDSDVR